MHPLPLAVILPTSPLLLPLSLVDYVSVHPTWLVHVGGMSYLCCMWSHSQTLSMALRVLRWSGNKTVLMIHYKIIVMDFTSVFCMSIVGTSFLWNTFSANTFSSSCSIISSTRTQTSLQPFGGWSGYEIRGNTDLYKISVYSNPSMTWCRVASSSGSSPPPHNPGHWNWGCSIESFDFSKCNSLE